MEKEEKVEIVKEEKKKGNKGLIIFLILIILGLTCYICYDKGVFDDLLGKEEPKPVENSQEEKLSEEEAMKLHDNLITTSKGFGFYFNRKVSIDEMPADLMLQYAIANYLDENNIKYNTDNYYTICGDYSEEYYFCNFDDESDNPKEISNDTTKEMTIKKETIDKYIKDHFSTDRDFIYKERMFIQTKNNFLDVSYNASKKEYYLTIPHRGGDITTVDSKFISFEENNNEVVITDKAVVCFADESGTGCSKNIYVDSNHSDDNTTLFAQGNNGKVYDKNYKIISDGNKYFGKFDESKKNYNYNFDLIFENFNSELNTYKHTFKKAADGKYYWYSSEIVKE